MLTDFILRILKNGFGYEYFYSCDALWNFRIVGPLWSRNKGKHTVVIGSHIVGRPMSILMGRKGFQETQQLL
jgi:5,10-methylene-tetrahydrofolate dehydrogenase/methenyl tetrahydrofolate cyclohydrolase